MKKQNNKNVRQWKKILISFGLIYNYSKMLSGEELVKLAGGLRKEESGFSHAGEYGIRALKVVGKRRIIIAWDCGSNFYQIINFKRIKRGNKIKWIKKNI